MNPFKRRRAPAASLAIAFLATGLGANSHAQDRDHAALPSPYGVYGDNGLPFFCQTLDARDLPESGFEENLTPRGIILHLEHGYHACFDPDLLRLALVWKERAPGDYLEMKGMAPGSYRQPHQKAPAGQSHLPAPLGSQFLGTGLYPGWHRGREVRREDPRARSVDPAEVGRGPLPPARGRWLGLRLDRQGPALLYEIAGTRIEDRVTVAMRESMPVVRRLLQIGPHEEPLTVSLSERQAVTLEPSTKTERWELAVAPQHGHPAPAHFESTPAPRAPAPARFWKDVVRVRSGTTTAPGTKDPFSVDEIPLPLPNPWKRNVRPSDFDFFQDGRLALVTFDGDVWIADGVVQSREVIAWRRFASGLHEPMGLRVVNGQLVVFDRNGLVRLIDRDNNGEADFYENFSSIAAQTAETREFAMGFELKPGGGFYLSKGGQVADTRGRYNGTILELSPDGQDLQIVATGLRQPFLGVDPKTGLLTASDQQGHWVPATPLHVIQRGAYYGFQPARLGADANRGRTINEPPLWIPHFVNQSGARQVWLRNARMGALNDSLIHLAYNRPALFKIYLQNGHRQGAVVPILENLPTGLLAGRVNPQDGLLYLAGLNLWGTVGKRIQGLYRLRPTGNPSFLPREILTFREGVVLRFDEELVPEFAGKLANYTVDRWNYKRSNNYGSGHYKLDGSPGQESLALSCVYLSEDQHSVFLGIPDMKPAHSLRLTYTLDAQQVQNAYLTLREFRPVNLTELGFEETAVDLVPKISGDGLQPPPPSATEGLKVATQFGCLACHSTDGSKKVAEDPTLVVGPTWKGLYGSKRLFTDDTSSEADEVYLRESILDPARRVIKGFETTRTGVGMPSYLGVLRNDQVESLIHYIQSLK